MWCRIPIASVLLVAPFNHVWGATMYANVAAVNAQGNSVASVAGGGV